jgi:hypothetical protein
MPKIHRLKQTLALTLTKNIKDVCKKWKWLCKNTRIVININANSTTILRISANVNMDFAKNAKTYANTSIKFAKILWILNFCIDFTKNSRYTKILE